ncbi:MAG: hypothetical protein ACR2H3_16420, partial [Acidimicrobiales bacterium]
FQEFNIRLSEFGQKLGLGRQAGLALVWNLDLKDDNRAYYVKKTDRGNIVYPRLERKGSTPRSRGDRWRA